MLTDGVDQHPHCVLLLDEIEKAHPDVYNLLLQVMDHGKLTDHNGRTVDFRNVILIMSSNAGAAEQAANAIGFGRTKREGEDKAAIEKTFTPEFRNRLGRGHLLRRVAARGHPAGGREVRPAARGPAHGARRIDRVVDRSGELAGRSRLRREDGRPARSAA